MDDSSNTNDIKWFTKQSNKGHEFEVGKKPKEGQSATASNITALAATVAIEPVSVTWPVDDVLLTPGFFGLFGIQSYIVRQSSSSNYCYYVQITTDYTGTYRFTDETGDVYELAVADTVSDHIIRYSSAQPTIVKVGYF